MVNIYGRTVSSVETLILASGSPRRQELLQQAGIPFRTDAPEVDETCSLPAGQAVAELSRRKAFAAGKLHPGCFILAADTLVSADGVSLGKPADSEAAVQMLHALSGRTHQVYTGVTVLNPKGESYTETDCSSVTFCSIPESELVAYAETSEPYDKAGAYAIQGHAALWITHVEGCFSSVIGLPLYLVRELLIRAGFPFPAAVELR